MRYIHAADIEHAVAELCITACCCVPADVMAALEKALFVEAEGGAARAVLNQIIENHKLAAERMRPCCQDTGLAVVFLDVGLDVHIEGDVYCAVNKGVRRGYESGFLRKSVLNAITRANTQDNTPAVIHVRFVAGDKLRIAVAPKGFGSENKSRLFMLDPSQGVDGIVESIVKTVLDAGASACPPVVVGVGIGGTMEAAALLAKRQLLRPLGAPSPDTRIAGIEREALELINKSGVGPMGLGGATTALAVHAEALHTHIAGLPVAVNLQCHACRHAERTL